MENLSKSQVIGRCGGDEKTEWSHRTDKSRTLKIFFILFTPKKLNIKVLKLKPFKTI